MRTHRDDRQASGPCRALTSAEAVRIRGPLNPGSKVSQGRLSERTSMSRVVVTLARTPQLITAAYACFAQCARR
jgi:hypothetical protein